MMVKAYSITFMRIHRIMHENPKKTMKVTS